MSVPRLYDMSVEDFRDVTQIDIDLMQSMCMEYHRLRSHLGMTREDVRMLPSPPAIESKPEDDEAYLRRIAGDETADRFAADKAFFGGLEWDSKIKDADPRQHKA